MKRNTIMLLALIGISGIMLVTHAILIKTKHAQEVGEELQVATEALYSVHEENASLIDIEVKSAGYEALDDWMKNRALETEAQYREDIKGIPEAQTVQQPMLHILSSTDEWDKYVDAMLDIYAYTGGAHGMPYIETAVLNKETGALVGLGDIFGTNEYLPQLSKLMIGKVSNLHEVFDGDTVRQALQPSATNFEVWQVGPDGVTFFYNPYEVAPFTAGIVNVLVTWDEIADFKK